MPNSRAPSDSSRSGSPAPAALRRSLKSTGRGRPLPSRRTSELLSSRASDCAEVDWLPPPDLFARELIKRLAVSSVGRVAPPLDQVAAVCDGPRQALCANSQAARAECAPTLLGRVVLSPETGWGTCQMPRLSMMILKTKLELPTR